MLGIVMPLTSGIVGRLLVVLRTVDVRNSEGADKLCHVCFIEYKYSCLRCSNFPSI